MYRRLERLLAAAFPSTCVACGRGVLALCEACIAADEPIVAPFADGSIARAAGPYDGPWRTAILAVKDGRRDVARRLAAIAASRLGTQLPNDVTYVGVPTARARIRARGFDQADLLAREIARALGAPVARLLVRVGDDTQRGRTRDERLAARARFALTTTAHPARVVLVDDVLTTGATLCDAAAVLEAAGIETREALVIAHARPRRPAAGDASATCERERP